MEKSTQNALVFGSGHIAYRVSLLLKTAGYAVTEISTTAFAQGTGIFHQDGFSWDTMALSTIQKVYIVDDNDDNNIEFLIAINSRNVEAPIAIAIFKRNIALHIQSIHQEILVINPGEISAPRFVAALDEKVQHTLSYTPPEINGTIKDYSFTKLLIRISAIFAVIITLSTLFFHYHNDFKFIDSLYFVIVTISTVGYGDISVLHSDALSKVMVMILMITSMVMVGLSFSFVMDELLKRRAATLSGIKKYSLKNHVIVCGLGRTSYFVIEKLLQKGEKVIIIEKNKDSPFLQYFKSKGAHFYIGDAAVAKTLQDANVKKAKGLISLVNDDSKNLEIALNARSLCPNLKLILRIYEEAISEEIKKFFDIQLTFSVSDIAAKAFISKTI